MNDGVRWLIVVVAVVLVVALVGFARGERQRGSEVESSRHAPVLLVDGVA